MPQVQELNRLFTTYLALARRFGLPEEIMDQLTRIQQMRIVAESTYRSIMLLYTASGPVGWAIAGGGLLASWLMFTDQMEQELRGR